jgi:hypothetical protein
MTGGGAFLIGADHGHGVAARHRLSRQGAYAPGEDAIVIADQDPHAKSPPGPRLEGSFREEIAFEGVYLKSTVAEAQP